MQPVQIWNVAGHEEGRDLPLSLSCIFGGTHQAIKDDEGLRGFIALENQIVIGLKCLLLDRDASQDREVGLAELRDLLELANEDFRG